MTIEELYGKIMADDALREDFAKAAESGDIAEWAKGQGVEATEDEIVAFAKSKADEKLDLGDVDQVAGGTSIDYIRSLIEKSNGGVCSK